MPLSGKDKAIMRSLAARGEAVLIDKHPGAERDAHLQDAYNEGRITRADLDYYHDWLREDIYAPAGKPWKKRLLSGGYAVGLDRDIKTFRSAEQGHHGEDIDLDEWVNLMLSLENSSMEQKVEYLQSRFPRNAAELAVAALDGNENPLDTDFGDIGESPSDLDIP